MGRNRFIIRGLDILIATVSLVALSPLFLILSLAILIFEGRPILFSQRRSGRNLKPFHMHKFRTMYLQREEVLVLGTTGTEITPFGALLRKSKLDELPQLWNVLSGEMSIVGPRPQLPYFVEKYREKFKPCLNIKPGLISPAALKYRNESALFDQAADARALYEFSFLPDKIKLDSELADGFGPIIYLRCLIRGVFILLFIKSEVRSTPVNGTSSRDKLREQLSTE